MTDTEDRGAAGGLNVQSLADGVVADRREGPRESGGELKMWLFIRRDLPMPPGKLAPQAGHGYATCLWMTAERDPETARAYMEQAQPKISVAVKDEAQLLEAVRACREAGLVAVTVMDSARTFFPEPVHTVGAVGPCLMSDLPKKVSRLRLFTEFMEPTEGNAG